MGRVGRIVPLLVLAVIGLTSRAEAARFDFGGAGGRGGLVYDGVEDVFTMNNECSVGGECATSALSDFLANSGVLISSTEDITNVTITSVRLLLIPTVDPNCGSGTDVDCVQLKDFQGTMGVSWQSANGFKDVSQSEQWIIRLLTENSQLSPLFYTLTDPAALFLGSLDASILANARLGLEVEFSSLNDTGFTAEIGEQDEEDVPEPASLALLALGVAGALRRRHLNRRAV